MTQPQIIPITEQHAEGFNRTVGTVAQERKFLSFFTPCTVEQSRLFILDNLAAGNPQFVVIDAGQVVGWCDITREKRETSRHMGTLGLGLLPAYRHKGLGRPLMRTTIDTSWQRGFERIELTVNSANRNAISLYLSLGFAIEGCRRRAVLIDGNYLDLYVMGLLRENVRP